MATYIPITDIPEQFFDSAGDPLVGGSLEFYLAGTTTATNAFSDNAGTSIGSTITLNAYGYPEAGGNTIGLFRDQSKALKIVLKNAAASTIWTMDDIPAVASFDSASSAKLDLITVTSAVDLDTMETDIGTAYQVDASVALTADITMPTTYFVNNSVAAALTASTTQTQSGGLALVNQVNQVATVANDNDAVTLPEAAVGRQCIVINNGANTLQVFPAADDSINALAADASVTIPAGESQIFEAISTIVWKTLLGSGTALATVAAATYTVLPDDGTVHVTYTATGTVAVTLPTAGVISDRKLFIKDAGGNAGTYNITIDTEGSETIDGAATQVLNGDYNSISLYSDGSNWFIY